MRPWSERRCIQEAVRVAVELVRRGVIAPDRRPVDLEVDLTHGGADRCRGPGEGTTQGRSVPDARADGERGLRVAVVDAQDQPRARRTPVSRMGLHVERVPAVGERRRVEHAHVAVEPIRRCKLRRPRDPVDREYDLRDVRAYRRRRPGDLPGECSCLAELRLVPELSTDLELVSADGCRSRAGADRSEGGGDDEERDGDSAAAWEQALHSSLYREQPVWRTPKSTRFHPTEGSRFPRSREGESVLSRT